MFTPWAADLGDSACMSFLNSTGQWSRKAPCDSAAEANLAFVCELDKRAKGERSAMGQPSLHTALTVAWCAFRFASRRTSLFVLRTPSLTSPRLSSLQRLRPGPRRRRALQRVRGLLWAERVRRQDQPARVPQVLQPGRGEGPRRQRKQRRVRVPHRDGRWAGVAGQVMQGDGRVTAERQSGEWGVVTSALPSTLTHVTMVAVCRSTVVLGCTPSW